MLADLDSAPSGAFARNVADARQADPGGKVGADDMRDTLAAGASPHQLEDALAVCAAFNTTHRLADAFGFELHSPEDYEAGAKYLPRWQPNHKRSHATSKPG